MSTQIDRDEYAVSELTLYVGNTYALYVRKMACFNALARKVQRGIYDPSKAPRMFAPLLCDAGKAYAREFGDGATWHRTFTVAQRRFAAADLTDEFTAWLQAGCK